MRTLSEREHEVLVAIGKSWANAEAAEGGNGRLFELPGAAVVVAERCRAGRRPAPR
ncbi:hypothetical protein [Streptomyces sp. HM190]|uniref:hypothetical protein n=1 Tax=Streptomyces sp. HM190 TaxID=2695266 RepID=UPI003FA75D15